MSADETVEATLTRLAIREIAKATDLLDRVDRWEASEVLCGVQDAITHPVDAEPRRLSLSYRSGWYGARGLHVPTPKRRRRAKS
jgi:hypothetical protein